MMVAAFCNQLEVVRYLREVVGEDAATTDSVREREREFLAELPVHEYNGPLWCYQYGRTALWYADTCDHKEVCTYLRLDVTPQQVLSPG